MFNICNANKIAIDMAHILLSFLKSAFAKMAFVNIIRNATKYGPKILADWIIVGNVASAVSMGNGKAKGVIVRIYCAAIQPNPKKIGLIFHLYLSESDEASVKDMAYTKPTIKNIQIIQRVSGNA
jgi:hypothetical protein